MLRALQELGAYLIENEGRGSLDDYLDTDKMTDYDRVIAVQFRQSDGGYTFDDVAIYDLDSRESDVMYKWGSPRGGDWTPTSRVTRIHTLNQKKDPETKMDTITRVFELWFQKAKLDDPKVGEVVKEYESREAELRDAIVEKYGRISGEEAVLTVQYEDDDGAMSFISGFDLFVDAIKIKVATKWAEKHDEESRSEDDRCTLCHEQRAVLGFAFPFAFYTVDNKKFAPDFDRGRSWQNLPLCEDCALELRVGRNFVEENNFSFHIGEPLQYYVVPSFPIGGPKDDRLMVNILEGSGGRDYSFMHAERFYEQTDVEYPVNLDIVIYRSEQSSQKIERHVEEVSPPWMRKADQTLRDTHSIIYLKHSLTNIDHQLDDTETLKQLDTLIYRTLPNTYGDPKGFLNDALDLTERILTGDDIEYDRLLALVSDEIHSRLRNNNNYRGYVLRVFLLHTFLTRLDILKHHGSPMKDYEDIKANWEETVPDDVQQFFADFPEAFNTPAKRAVFLEGVLAQHLIDVQSQIRNSNDAPLRKKLSGLRLTVDRVQTLLPDLYQDIDAYDRKSDYPIEYRALRTATARYFAEADDKGWNLPDEEVRYCFVLGMSLNRVFKERSENDQQDRELMEELEAE